ncbi:hypothetical protein BJY22_006054 [Kribbella shirazensis]|uniref:Uncharacterized protein n=1 Tax=Kribbella shirazensis TaxID=1105143 RepID=A0A7X5VH06_9ACTN|nr:hypothetical protein [Kribbella shirazensis]
MQGVDLRRIRVGADLVVLRVPEQDRLPDDLAVAMRQQVDTVVVLLDVPTSADVVLRSRFARQCRQDPLDVGAGRGPDVYFATSVARDSRTTVTRI